MPTSGPTIKLVLTAKCEVTLMNIQESRRVEIMDWSEPPLEGQLADHTLWPGV